MKIVLAGFGSMMGVAFVVAASCSIEHATDDIACATQTDCDTSRTCVDGYCVVTTGSSGCPAGCTACDTTAMTCTMAPSETTRSRARRVGAARSRAGTTLVATSSARATPRARSRAPAWGRVTP